MGEWGCDCTGFGPSEKVVKHYISMHHVPRMHILEWASHFWCICSMKWSSCISTGFLPCISRAQPNQQSEQLSNVTMSKDNREQLFSLYWGRAPSDASSCPTFMPVFPNGLWYWFDFTKRRRGLLSGLHFSLAKAFREASQGAGIQSNPPLKAEMSGNRIKVVMWSSHLCIWSFRRWYVHVQLLTYSVCRLDMLNDRHFLSKWVWFWCLSDDHKMAMFICSQIK